MATTRQDIETLASEYDKYYSLLKTEQREDERYYNDTFNAKVPDPYLVKRTGMGRKIINTIAENIVSTNPKVYREPRATSETSKEKNTKVSRLLNTWVSLLLPEIQTGIKYLPLRGEAYYQVEFNLNDKRPLLYAPDPLYVYPDPVENQGIPIKVIKKYRVPLSVVKARYPDWKPSATMGQTSEVEYLAYWDDMQRYIGLDKDIIMDVHPNVWKTVPFVHAYSGLGITGQDVAPENKSVGKLRELRDILIEECGLESMIYSIIGLWANPILVLSSKLEGGSITAEEAQSIQFEPGNIARIPAGIDWQVVQGAAPSPELFRHLDNVRARLGLEVPPITAGIASSSRTSGRLEDILGESYKNKYRMMAFNVAEALSRALSMALKIAVNTNAFPITIRTVEFKDGQNILKEDKVDKDDIDGNFECTVELQPNDPLERDRNLMLLQKLCDANRITWRRLLIDGYGMTPEEADNEIDEVMAETAMRENPIIAEILVREAIEKAGGYKYLRELQGMPVTGGGGGLAQGATQPRNLTGDVTSKEAVAQMLRQSPVGVRSFSGTEQVG